MILFLVILIDLAPKFVGHIYRLTLAMWSDEKWLYAEYGGQIVFL
jgi:hypothetical protein